MDKNTKPIFWAILLGSLLVSATVAITGRYQITGGTEGAGSYVIRDNWTGRSWYEAVRRY